MPHPYLASFLFIPSLYPSLFNSKNFYFLAIIVLHETISYCFHTDVRKNKKINK